MGRIFRWLGGSSTLANLARYQQIYMNLTGLLRGKKAEEQAASYLQNQGLIILAKNARYKCGEIDIIAIHKDTHVFVEVKYRKNNHHGESSEMVSASKQAKVAKASKLWLQENDPNFEKGCRFDVIAITKGHKDREELNIQWIKNAFTPELW